MSDEVIPKLPKPVSSIVITLYEGGRVDVNHPDDEVLARGMLDMAHSQMTDHFRAIATLNGLSGLAPDTAIPAIMAMIKRLKR